MQKSKIFMGLATLIAVVLVIAACMMLSSKAPVVQDNDQDIVQVVPDVVNETVPVVITPEPDPVPVVVVPEPEPTPVVPEPKPVVNNTHPDC